MTTTLLCSILLGIVLLLSIVLVRFYQLKKSLDNKEETIALMQEKLIFQEKMAALGQLTAGIAHEIKNPLNFVHNFAEGSAEIAEDLTLELQKYRGNIDPNDFPYFMEMLEDLKQNALDIRSHGRRIDRIVKSMMNQARGTHDKFQEVDINSLVEENVNLAYQGYRALEPAFDVRIHTEYDPSIPPFLVLQQDLGRVLLNILNNACYALNQKQKELSNSYRPELRVLTKANEDEVEIRICDNGPGIPTAVREDIFKPFFSTKPLQAGNTGLGLSISRDIIVDRHHGQLRVESEPGKFTEFIIILPKAS